MLSEHKIAAMAKMSIYEKGHGKKDIQIYEHFKWDYVSKNMVLASLWMSVIYILIVVGFTLLNIDNFLLKIVNDKFMDVMMMLAFGLLCVWVACGFIFYFVYASQYQKAQKNGFRYYKEMKKLNHIYEKEAEYEGNL